MEHILVSSAGLYSLLLSSIPSPAASRGKEEGNPEFDNPKVDGHPTGAASHGMVPVLQEIQKFQVFLCVQLQH